MERNAQFQNEQEEIYEGRKKKFMDIDRMVNEGLAGGQITDQESGLIAKGASFPKKEDPPMLNGEILPDSVVEELKSED